MVCKYESFIMVNFKRIMFVLAFLCASTLVQASDWRYIMTSSNGTKVYLDYDYPYRYEHGFWYKAVFPNDRYLSDGTPYRTTFEFVYVDLDRDQILYRDYVFYDKYNRRVSQGVGRNRWSNIPSGSVIETLVGKYKRSLGYR